MRRFRFCGDLDCPDWVLAEISTLAKIVKWKLSLSLFSSGSYLVPSTLGSEQFLLLNPPPQMVSGAVKPDDQHEALAVERGIYGLREQWEYLCDASRSELWDSGLALPLSSVNRLDSVSWRVDHTLSSSELQQVNEPLVHLKFTVRDRDRGVTEPFAMTMSAEKFRVLLAELRQAHAMMKTLS
uniref:COMM domain-containing protein n=1 Tax=Terrapene triunguis TaxID=2587831 RepID=A0A674JN89_9SAUR